MNRIADCFERLKRNNQTALIPFITAGDPSPTLTVPLMHTLVEAGANIIELGVPFSDPMADGPVIQKANERALAQGTHLTKVLELVEKFRVRDQETPVVLMGYLNPVEIMGYETFAQTAQAAGVSGVLTVDLPPEEASDLLKALQAHDLTPIFLIAPNTTPQRIQRICKQAGGYLYYVSFKGVTGADRLEIAPIASKIAEIRQYTSLPVGVGFGIRNAETAAQVAKISDAVIIGSALVRQVETVAQDKLLEVIAQFMREVRLAMDSA
jgi:tryptophan synthase alpha chain